MNKKLLLSTVLTSTILASTVVKAAVYQVTYDGNNKYTFGGTQYTGLDTLRAYIATPGNFDLENDDIKISAASARAFIDALKVEGSAERDSFSKAIADEQGLNLEQVKAEINEAMAFLSKVDDTFGLDIEDYTDFKDLFKADFEEIKEAYKFFKEFENTIGSIRTADQKFDSLETKLAESNASIKALVDEKNALLAIANKTEEQNAKLVEVINKIVSSDEFSDLRTSPEVQEALKQNIELIKIKLQANENSNLSENGREELENFISSQASKYLVLNPKATDKLPAVQQPDNAAAESILESMIANRTVLDSRIGSLGGVSSGDMMETYGVWAKGSFTQATQKAHAGSQGYKLDSKGITVGIDTGDESLIGIAYSFFKNDVKNKTVSKNKEDITSHTISAYGKYVATPEIFISGQGQFGIAEIKKKRATGDLANNIATAKPKATTLGAKAEIGYDYAAMEGVHIIPAVGISYTDVKVKGYKESGNGLNRKVGKINASRTSGIASLTAKYFADMGSMKLVPEIHANIDYAFNSKNGNTVVTLVDGLPAITTPSKKLEKGRYNVGTSVKAIQSEKLEFSAGYDFGFAKKFQSHTGVLKVRVNF